MEDYKMKSSQNKDGILLQLNNEEAIVLLNWLFRFNEAENEELFEDQAEQRVLWDIETIFEQTTSEIFDEDYAKILSQARAKIRDKE
ncbi:MAG: hypothetical protein R6U85_00660 [Salinivirgaceae bacterium]